MGIRWRVIRLVFHLYEDRVGTTLPNTEIRPAPAFHQIYPMWHRGMPCGVAAGVFASRGTSYDGVRPCERIPMRLLLLHDVSNGTKPLRRHLSLLLRLECVFAEVEHESLLSVLNLLLLPESYDDSNSPGQLREGSSSVQHKGIRPWDAQK